MNAIDDPENGGALMKATGDDLPIASPAQPKTGQAHMYMTPSHLLEYLYCPRFTYFEYSLGLPEYQQRRYKVRKGREVHRERQKINPRYLRKKLGVVRRQHDVKLASERLRLKGVVDELLWLEDGSVAPFDYKFAAFKGRVFRNLQVQSVLYGLMARDGLSRPCNRGFICYTRSNHRIVEVPFTDTLVGDALNARDEVFHIIRTGYFPEATRYKARCPDCCYRRVCIR
ncbi:MAG TPA: CRISPR-associated protein Cas4 [Acidobacteriota bacterium]|nr:CRISPR-associated protein Cas4 [Acidobacteriota bacterium]